MVEAPADVQRGPRHRRRDRQRGLPVVVAVAAVGLLALAWVVITYPYRGDQAVFALMGRQFLTGAVPYVQLWDVKQPGIFLWYGLADLTGLREVGSRILDVLGAAAIGLLVGVLVRRYTASSPAARWWIPALATAAVLLAAGPGDFGQIELLGLVPALGAFALVDTTGGRRPTVARLAAAGLCLGALAMLKLPLAAVTGAALLLLLALTVPRSRWAGVAGVLVASSLVPVVAVLAWLTVDGALGATLTTWFVSSAEMGAVPGSRSLPRLLEGAGRFAFWMAPAVVLAGLQAVSGVRSRDPLDLAMLAWLVLDVACVAVQFGWWYQWYFLTGPLLVLALRQAVHLLASGALRRPVALAAAVVVSLPMLAHGGAWLGGLVLDGGGFTAASRERIDDRVGDYDTVRAELAAVDLRPAESLYVIGDPLYNYLSDHPLVVRTDGWAYDLMTGPQWDDLEREIAAGRPTVVLVDHLAAEWVRDRGPGVAAELGRDYTVVRSSDEGTWYRLKAA